MKIRNNALLCFVLLLSLHQPLAAQDKMDLKFGKISPQEFKLEGVKFDTSAGAVYIADIGLTEFEGNTKGGYSVIFKRHVRIKILNKQGFDAANFDVMVYDFGDREQKLEKLKAVTYNLEDGKIVETKLDENSVFKDKIDKYRAFKKFTLPGVKEGSIIEVSYNLKSDNSTWIRPWDFQGKYPRLWSEYEVRIPQFLDYVFLTQGTHPFHIKKTNVGYKYYTIIHDLGTSGSAMDQVKSSVYEHRMVMKDVPPLKEESFVTTLDNFNSSIQFQLSAIKEPYKPQSVMGTWFKASEELMKDEDFGAALEKPNNWLDDDMKKIVGGATTQLDKARNIYHYIRSNFTCTDHDARWMQKGLKDVFKARNGNVCEINMLLMAMLRHEGIEVEPVMLSTRDNGLTHAYYPILDRFNYVIAGAVIDGGEYYLD
ncbi:MAG TPA: transglutaminase domain-containing protein, partial [Chitinophagaceae bacterium]